MTAEESEFHKLFELIQYYRELVEEARKHCETCGGNFNNPCGSCQRLKLILQGRDENHIDLLPPSLAARWDKLAF